MKDRIHKLGGLIVTAALVAGACGDNGGDNSSESTLDEGVSAPSVGGSIVVGLEAETDGHRTWEDPCAESCLNVRITLYDTILARGEDGALRGMLAESFEANDDLTRWTIVLRDGIEFTDGTPLTAQSIADMWPLQREGTTSAGPAAEAGLVDVVAEDRLTVTYVLDQPNAGFPDVLAGTILGGVFNASAIGDDNAASWNQTGPITTGPFTLLSWDRDNELVVERNPNYWRSDDEGNRLPYLDRITFRPMPDEGTRLDSLVAGDVDAITTLRESTVRDARAVGEDRVVMHEQQGSKSGGAIFNTLRPPVDDVRVRRGLITATDVDVLIEILGGAGISVPATQLYSPQSPWYSEEAAEAYPSYDPEAAEELLSDYVNDPNRSDGKPAGEPIQIEFKCWPDPSLSQVTQAYQEFWEATGLVEVDLSQAEQTVVINETIGADNNFEGTFMVNCWRQGADTDPAGVFGNAFGPPEQSLANFTNYYDEEMYNKLIDAKETDDVDQRKAVYDDVLMQIAQDVPYLFTSYTIAAVAARPDVGGFAEWTLPDGTPGMTESVGYNPWPQVYVSE